MQIDCAARGRLAMVAALVRRLAGLRRAQSAVEFAIALPLLLVTLLVGIQYAILGEAALALGQVNYQGARYASLYTNADQPTVQAYMVSVASPTIAANNGQYLSSTLSGGPPCTSGSTVTVSVTFDANHLLALPNPLTLPFVGSISFPAMLTSSESALCEGSTD